jgi:hypothetical protein
MKCLKLKALYPILLSCVVLGANAQVPINNIAAYYPFSGNANDWFGTNNGTVSGAVLATDRFGNPNSAYSLNGTSDFISFPQQFVFNKKQNASFSIWIKPNSLPNNLQGTILKSSLATADANRFNLYLSPLNGKNLRLTLDYRESNGTLHKLNGDSLALGTWQNLVFTRSGNSYMLYLNGKYVNKVVMDTSTIPNATGWLIGKDPSSGYDYSGLIDDIRLYSKALDSSEIVSIYNENTCFKSISVTDTLKISFITGLNDLTQDFGLMKVYPNPSSSNITLEAQNTTGNYSVKINNSFGQPVCSSVITQSKTIINLSSLGSGGIFYLQVLDNQNKVLETKKLILE